MTITSIFLKALIIMLCVYYLFTRTRFFIRRERTQTLIKLFATYCIWGSILLLTVFPRVAREISSLLGFGENLNTLIFIGFIILFLIVYKLLRTIESLESTITAIVSQDAFRNIKTTHGEQTYRRGNRSHIQRKAKP